jgi:hypothetical protein
MFTRAFWKATLERMVRTFAQAVVALIGGDGLGLVDVDWGDAFSIGGLAAVAALLTAIVASGGGPTGPGLTETAVTTHRPRPLP